MNKSVDVIMMVGLFIEHTHFVIPNKAFMYNHAILCIFSPNLEVEINIYTSNTGTNITYAITIAIYRNICRNVNSQGIVI